MTEPKIESEKPAKDLEEAQRRAQEEEHAGTLMQEKIKHVVVLVLENRGFDHFLGWLYDRKKENLDKTINFVGDPDAINPWTKQKMRKWEGLGGLDEKELEELENPCHFIDESKKTHTKSFRPVKGARAANIPQFNCHEDFVHIMEDMYFGNTDLGAIVGNSPLAQMDLHEKMKSRAFRDQAIKKNGRYIQPRMKGWVQNFADAIEHHAGVKTFDDDKDLSQVMDMYTPDQLPVMNWLARHYAVSDLWFCSVPSQTTANRAFYVAGTSAGLVKNNFYDAFAKTWRPAAQVLRYFMEGSHCDAFFPRNEFFSKAWSKGTPIRTMFDVLPKEDWRYYWNAYWPPYGAGGGQYLRVMFPQFDEKQYDANFAKMDQFWKDARGGTLAPVSVIEPSWGGGPAWEKATRAVGNEFHPSCDTACGEFFVKKIYDVLSQSAAWPNTLLVIIFDENGGTYDHFSPWPVNAGPAERDLAPEYHLHADMDKETRSQYGFRFDMYGVRVPALLISPYIRPNTVFRSNNGVPFDHTSLIATILQWRRIKRADWQLGSRVLQAPTFEGVLQGIEDGDGGKDRMRPPEHETLGIRPVVRPGKDPKKALRYGEHVYLKFIGNKWRKSHEGPAYLGGPAIWGRVVKGGWWYPVFKEKRKEAITFLIAGPDKSNAAGEVGNGVPLQFKVATGDAAGYRLAVPEYTPKRALGSKTAYLTPDEDRGTLWHTWLIGDRISGKPLHPADEVYLFTDRYWWEPDKSGSEVSVGFVGGYDPYQKLTISEGNPEYAGFRAGEWDVWMIERAADPAPALIDGSSEKPVAASGARKDDEVEPILQLAEAWQQSAQKSEELRGDLIDRWTALGKKHGYKAEQMVPDAAQRDKLLRVIEQVYVNVTAPSGKAQDKLRVDDSRRNDTEKDGNCFFHAVCGSLRDLLAKGAVDRALIDIGKEKGHVACRAETVRALGEFRKTSPRIVKDWPKYIAGMSHTANGSGDREAWGGTVEMQALAHFGNLATKEGKPVRFMFREWSRLHLDPGYVDIGDAKGAVMIELINNNNGHWEWLTPKVGSQADDEAARLV